MDNLKVSFAKLLFLKVMDTVKDAADANETKYNPHAELLLILGTLTDTDSNRSYEIVFQKDLLFPLIAPEVCGKADRMRVLTVRTMTRYILRDVNTRKWYPMPSFMNAVSWIVFMHPFIARSERQRPAPEFFFCGKDNSLFSRVSVLNQEQAEAEHFDDMQALEAAAKAAEEG